MDNNYTLCLFVFSMQSPKFRFYKILIDGKDECTITYIFFCVNSFLHNSYISFNASCIPASSASSYASQFPPSLGPLNIPSVI